MENKTNLRISTKLNEEINKAKLKSEKIDIKNLNIIYEDNHIIVDRLQMQLLGSE